jgi:DNA-directed RNA polymerase omega subunit
MPQPKREAHQDTKMMNISSMDNKYFKVLVAAQRAKQIQKGARPLVQMPGTKATRVALEEVEQGLIGFEITQGEHAHRAGAGRNDGEANRIANDWVREVIAAKNIE